MLIEIENFIKRRTEGSIHEHLVNQITFSRSTGTYENHKKYFFGRNNFIHPGARATGRS